MHFRTAWRTFRVHPRVFIGSALVLFLLWALLEVLVISLQEYGTVINVLLHSLFLVLICGALLGLHCLALDALAGRSVRMAHVLDAFSRGPHFLAAAVLYLAVVSVGLASFIFPGVYLAVRYALFPQVMASGHAGPVDSLRQAGKLAGDRWWRVAVVLTQAALLTVLGAAVLGVGAFVTFPGAVIACSSLYTSLLRIREVPGERAGYLKR